MELLSQACLARGTVTVDVLLNLVGEAVNTLSSPHPQHHRSKLLPEESLELALPFKLFAESVSLPGTLDQCSHVLHHPLGLIEPLLLRAEDGGLMLHRFGKNGRRRLTLLVRLQAADRDVQIDWLLVLG